MRLIWMFLWAGAIALAQQKAAPRVELLETGEFGRTEIVVRSGGGWIGLKPSRDGFAWEKYRIAVTVTGTRAKVEPEAGEGEAPLFLLRGMPALGEQPVHTCFDRSEAGSFFVQNPILLTCEARAYRVSVSNMNRKLARGGASLLQFEHRGRRQILFRWPAGLTEQRAELVWAGDLDGDGELDLLIDHGLRTASAQLSLYLSSKAGPGELVRRVASFHRRLRN